MVKSKSKSKSKKRKPKSKKRKHVETLDSKSHEKQQEEKKERDPFIKDKHLSKNSLKKILRRSGVTHIERSVLDYMRIITEDIADQLCYDSLMILKSQSPMNSLDKGKKTIKKSDVIHAFKKQKIISNYYG
ncbi:hypothetical protein LCGC14_3034820 [marine sediment metagenome]|uniref:Transcription factor CBF/NF-Y/archaeal histone domain-containing protein n=1 Tax=marine sediment metagenome TaxID=412755 RepID=A0A0F8XEN9_9ZZZZ